VFKRFNWKKGIACEVDSVKFVEFNNNERSFKRFRRGLVNCFFKSFLKGKCVGLTSELSPNSCVKLGYKESNRRFVELNRLFSDNNKLRLFKVVADKVVELALVHKSEGEL
jgi:hypothetical protein